MIIVYYSISMYMYNCISMPFYAYVILCNSMYI